MRLLAQTVLTVSISNKERLDANQSAEIRTEAQHCVPLRMDPNFSDASFHIRSIPDVLSIFAADVNNFSSPEPLGSQGELLLYPSSRRPSVVRRRPSVRPSTFFKDLLLLNHLVNQSQILCGASLGRVNESLYKWSRSYDQDGRHAHIW